MLWKRKKVAVISPRKKVGVRGEDWVKCSACQANLYEKRFLENLWVCPRCQHHHRLTAWQRISITVDAGSFQEADAALRASDPLGFTAVKAYADKVAEAQEETGLTEAALAGRGTIGGFPAELVVTDSNFMMGSLGSVVGEKIVRAVERAVVSNTPLIIISASGGGARMYEGMFSLLQMAKTSAALGRLASAGVPYLSVLTDPTMAGVAASFAFLGDIMVAEPGALIGFTGPRVIEQTIRAKLPEGFQRSEFLFRKGALDQVLARREIKPFLVRALSLFHKD
ncbi:MAG TPA: acetyl-CoA carboxylase, carboxyltransferase subunit beta [bacterium]|uniref:Acetyl-coenzyme A carboxylase carboxyl transferase subunit beta n=1 Tax=candidate division TA06 bacterium ADurb.Bin417 TaxID=1852828 RepID=A0A1V5MF79_UNCT6|nr:MAG: Acetyl-coenzyme A carboxylase carboxyl transferase subunit beta [candidate division TA06 bacterium ADurb.Bin417]HNQ35503.1 acetyl-CoA carboxylase, carboxyltransferase subunit beta [bacterium]HNS48743.1 acetyl-CoA carboxylase, carboxyltransferase subunit beta [bacterium]